MTNRLRNEESGAVYVLMVLAIFVLMAMAAFAVDLGWIFLNKARAQRAADAAALAGVTALPAEPMTAIGRAHEFAKINGYDDADPNIVVSPTPTADNELRVQIDDDVDTFFMKVFGIDTVHIDVSAKARYISSVPLGNPDNIFGPEPGTPGQNFSDIGFWPAITFQYDAKRNGDPYATRCTDHFTSTALEGLACDDPPDNLEYYGTTAGEPDGYWYGIEVPSGATNLLVEVYDAGFGQAGIPPDDQVFPEETLNLFTARNETQSVEIRNAAVGGTYEITIGAETTLPIPVAAGGGAALDNELQALPSITSVAIDPSSTENVLSGDYTYVFEINNPNQTDFPLATCNAALLISADGINPPTCTVVAVTDGGSPMLATTTFRLHAPDDTPFDIRDNVPIPGCEVVGTNELVGSPTNYSWTTLCSVPGAVQPGLYPLRIFSGPGRSWNEFSLRANASGAEVRLFALEDLSIASSIEAGQTRFFLAEVAEQYRGLTFVVELFDPGDLAVAGVSDISILGPDGTIWDQGCTVTVARDPVGPPVYTTTVLNAGSGSPCTLDTTRTGSTPNVNDGYQADWVRFSIPLPGAYSCPLVSGAPFCWWQVLYDYPSKAGERTTWKASVEGSQVALVFEPEP